MPNRVTLLVSCMSAAVVLAGCDGDPVSSTAAIDPQFAKGGAGQAGAFVTPERAQARLVAGVSGAIVPLATVGDAMPGSGMPLAPIPDGIGIWGGQGYLSLMLNHELAGVETLDGGTAYDNAMVSRFTIDPRSMTIVDHSYVVDGSEGYQRLCSAEWVDARDGFPGGYFFTGEETDDGVQLAIDARGDVYELPWIGRYNHENQIAVPGFPGHVVVLNFDDKGGNASRGSLSELYMYVARNSNRVLRGQGTLYVFKSDDVANPGQLQPGQRISGYWVEIPARVAPDAASLQDYVHQEGAFPFVRLEDGFYDKRPGASPSAYFFDTGRSTVGDANGPWDPWGSIYRIDFDDPADPAGGSATLHLLARSSGPADGWASPDNGDMNADGVVMLQEDPANGPWTRRPAIYRFTLAADGTLADPAGTRIVEVQDPDDPTDEASAVFDWETSGIVDASEYFGANSWIFTVQAHDKTVPSLGLAEDNGQALFLELH